MNIGIYFLNQQKNTFPFKFFRYSEEIMNELYKDIKINNLS